MNNPSVLPRSVELMTRHDTGLLVVDVQEKLISLVAHHERIVWNISRLIEAAQALAVPVTATEQYPKGLGSTVPELAASLPVRPDKVAFSCGACGSIFEGWHERSLSKILIAGIETHVCVQQTAFDLLADGWRVYIAVDAVGTRHGIDHEIALRRMESAGATLTTTESAMFEWCETAGAAEFKTISRLVQKVPPAEASQNRGV